MSFNDPQISPKANKIIIYKVRFKFNGYGYEFKQNKEKA